MHAFLIFVCSIKFCTYISVLRTLSFTRIPWTVWSQIIFQVYKETKLNRDLLKNQMLESFLGDNIIPEEDANLTKLFSHALGIDVTR